MVANLLIMMVNNQLLMVADLLMMVNNQIMMMLNDGDHKSVANGQLIVDNG